MTRVLVPVRVLKGETVSPGLIDLLGTVDVTILGYHALPEQTSPDQARLQYEERATAALEDLSDSFRNAGGAADHRLVFTHDREQTIDRIADETDSRAFAVLGTASDIDSLLVSLTGAVDSDRILAFVIDLVGDREIDVTLLAASDESDGDATGRLDDAAAQLRDAGVSVQTEQSVGESPFKALMQFVPGHDAIVMGERAPSFRSLLFGDEADRVASASVGPVIVVRDEAPTDERQ